MTVQDLAAVSEADLFYSLFSGNINLSVLDKDFSKYLRDLRVFAFLADLYAFTLEFQANRAERLVLPIFTAPEGLVFEYNPTKKTVFLYLSSDPFGGNIVHSSKPTGFVNNIKWIIERTLTGILSLFISPAKNV